MFDLKAAYNTITVEEILSKVTEWSLWKHYCGNFETLDRSFRSELYNDNNPSCRIYQTNGRLRYKDFGTGDNLNIFEYIQKKYNCTFNECLNIISNDFGLSNNQIIINKQQPIIQLDETITIRPRIKIEIVIKPFNLVDYKYWNQYHIPLTLLEEYNVFSCKEVLIHKKDDIFKLTSSLSNPIYAYRFTDNNEYTYKIYSPLADRKSKWIFNGRSNNIEGYDQLNLSNNVLILTKSLKDCMCYRVLGYDAISLQGESNKLDKELVNKLYKRFDNIVVNYDNDSAGISATQRLVNQYGFKHFYIDDAKDLSDYMKNYGLTKAKQLINDKVNKCIV